MKRRALALIDKSDLAKTKLDFKNQKEFLAGLADFKDGQRVWVSVETYYPTASTEQRGVLHWYCTEIANYLGMEMEEFKDQMKLKYAWKERRDKNDEIIYDPETNDPMMYVQSTEAMNSVEKFEFTEKIRIWAMDYLAFYLPEPDKNWKLQLK